MKHLAYIMILLLSAPLALAQQPAVPEGNGDIQLEVITPAKPEKQETKKERKAREKREKQRVDSIAHMKAIQALEQGYFVILADNISLGVGGFVTSGINSNANFLLCQNDGGIFQLAFNNGSMGYNGLGGVTLHGRVGERNIVIDKKGNVSCTYHMNGMHMAVDVLISMPRGTDRVTATVTPTFGSTFSGCTLRGRLVPYRNKSIKIEY